MINSGTLDAGGLRAFTNEVAVLHDARRAPAAPSTRPSPGLGLRVWVLPLTQAEGSGTRRAGSPWHEAGPPHARRHPNVVLFLGAYLSSVGGENMYMVQVRLARCSGPRGMRCGDTCTLQELMACDLYTALANPCQAGAAELAPQVCLPCSHHRVLLEVLTAGWLAPMA